MTYLKNICSSNKITQCDVVRLQLRHGYEELEHYNSILLGQQMHRLRRRRGLINGVGYVARSLFGILDKDFAENYQKDIDLIRKDQKHLALLWKNQTSIVEVELNVIKRVETALEKQHRLINQHIINCNPGMNKPYAVKSERYPGNAGGYSCEYFL